MRVPVATSISEWGQCRHGMCQFVGVFVRGDLMNSLHWQEEGWRRGVACHLEEGCVGVGSGGWSLPSLTNPLALTVHPCLGDLLLLSSNCC